MKKFYFVLIILVAFKATSQVGINTTSPIPQASLQVEGSDSGVLINRVALTGRNDTSTIPGLGVSGAATAAQGLMIYNTATNGSGTNAVKPGFYNWNGSQWTRLINEDSVSDYTGWAVYNDTQFTSASPGFVNGGTTYFMPNNAGNTIDSQKPVDINTFYDISSQTITGRNGDGLNVVIEFKMRPLTNNVTRVTLGIDIGAPVGEIYTRDFVLNRGENEEHYYLSSFNAYTLGTWEANGGRVLIRTTRNVEIYDIRYVLTRTHKAR